MGLKILLIEDDRDIRESVVEILELEGFNVHTASNGLTGLEIAFSMLPDMVLCDIAMPGADGYTVCKALKTNIHTAHIPFVFMTSKAEKRDEAKAAELKSDGYLIKPFDDVKLLTMVTALLKKSNDL